MTTVRSEHRKPRLAEIVDGVPAYRGLDLLVPYDDRLSVSGNSLSFGEKRLFAFLWHCTPPAWDATQPPVVADELTGPRAR